MIRIRIEPTSPKAHRQSGVVYVKDWRDLLFVAFKLAGGKIK